jgi:hypothetical protein
MDSVCWKLVAAVIIRGEIDVEFRKPKLFRHALELSYDKKKDLNKELRRLNLV